MCEARSCFFEIATSKNLDPHLWVFVVEKGTPSNTPEIGPTHHPLKFGLPHVLRKQRAVVIP